MKKDQIYFILFFLILVAAGIISFNTASGPYTVEGNTFIQTEKRRNDSTSWELVWEDQFDQGRLDTNKWSKIGLYTSERLIENFPKVKTDKNAWKEIVDLWASYASATNP
ncbi:MAG: hypothetical protein QGH61_10995, partial [Candidatus Marinimicrobia bacterium]|nr:hypothetical protein [Candidatus Neomarinimicrobiota bacterium]